MCKINIYDKISFILLLIGSLNWGSIGLFNFNFISTLAVGTAFLIRIIYILVFVSAINIIYLLFKCNLVKFSK